MAGTKPAHRRTAGLRRHDCQRSGQIKAGRRLGKAGLGQGGRPGDIGKAAQKVAHPRQQQTFRGRGHDYRISPGPKCCQPRRRITGGGHRNYRDEASNGIGPQTAQHLFARHVGQGHRQQDQIGPKRRRNGKGHIQTALPVRRQNRIVKPGRQSRPVNDSVRCHVIDYKDASAHLALS